MSRVHPAGTCAQLLGTELSSAWSGAATPSRLQSQVLLAGGFSGGQQFTADYLWAAPDFIVPEFSIKLGLRQGRWLLVFWIQKRLCPRQCYLSPWDISALCLDAFHFIMVSTPTSTNISLLLLREQKQKFPRQHSRDLGCVTNVQACEAVGKGQAESLHSCREGTGCTQSLFWQRRGQSLLRLPPTGTGHIEGTIRTDICVFHNSW